VTDLLRRLTDEMPAKVFNYTSYCLLATLERALPVTGDALIGIDLDEDPVSPASINDQGAYVDNLHAFSSELSPA
jgi:hypothetical protein